MTFRWRHACTQILRRVANLHLHGMGYIGLLCWLCAVTACRGVVPTTSAVDSAPLTLLLIIEYSGFGVLHMHTIPG